MSRSISGPFFFLLLERIDAKHAERIDEPDRSAMIRELVALGLEALDRKGRK